MGIWRLALVLFTLFSQFTRVELHGDEENYKYQLAVATIFRNDAPYLREWIEFHRLVGVEHFWLYNNSSTDDYAELLAPYVEEGIVDLFDWGSGQDDWNGFCFGVQPAAYRDAISRARSEEQKTKWLALIDSDEFVFPVEEYSLLECLERYYSDCSGVCVNWQLYGTSGVERIPSNKLMIEMLLYKAPHDYPRNRYYKSIVQPADVNWCHNPHYCTYHDGHWHVNTDRERVEAESDKILLDKIRINHYWTRDEDYTYNVKMPRYHQWLNNGEVVKAAIAELSVVYDDGIWKYVPALRRCLGMRDNKKMVGL